MAKIDDSVKKKVPELRFPGFTDDWEERKLGDLLKEFSIKSKIEDEHKVLSSTNSGMEFREGRVSGTSNLGYKIIKNGDLVLSPQNLWLGNININNIGKGLVSPSYKTFEFINIDSSFINPQLRTQKMLEEYKNSSTQGASVVRRNLEIDSFYQIKIFVPTISEQEKIGSFFKQLDDTIALHQRKLDLLKEQKKGYLQKMFPKNGAKVPELRFAGFADDWEERKLSDIADRFDNLRVPITASDRKPGDTPYYGANGIQDYVEGFTHNGEFILVAEDGANDLKNYPVQYVNGKVWVNNHAHVLQGKKTITDNKFLMNAIKNFNIEPFLVGGGRAKLNADVMMKLNILLPTFVEQEKIGSLFSLLDKTIALHQHKLDLLKEQKKGFLQKMFV